MLAAAVAVLGGLLALLVPPVVDQFAGLDIGITAGVDHVQQWLADSPLPLNHAQITNLVDDLQQQLAERFDTIAASAASGAFVVLEVVAGLLLALVVLFFLLKDGERIWAWTVSLAPPQRRDDVAGDGRACLVGARRLRPRAVARGALRRRVDRHRARASSASRSCCRSRC